MNFDKVELNHPDGSKRVLTPGEFKGLASIEKVQWISQGRFRFYRAGESIRPADALKVTR